MTDIVKIPRNEIPPELYSILRIQQGKTAQRKTYLPLVYVDELSQRIRDLVVINSTDKSAVVEIKYEPISWGKLRLFLQFSNALRSMGDFGFKVRSDHINISVVLKGLILLNLQKTEFKLFKRKINIIQEKDTDEVKGIFADTNMALLMVTFAVSAVHLLFDFLAFKNDISFWKGRTNMVSITHNVPEFDSNI